MFKKIDTDNDGIVNIEDLKAGIHNFSSQLAEPEIQMLIEAVSILIYQVGSPFFVVQFNMPLRVSKVPP